VKWLVLAVVVILVAPSIASRLKALDPDNADNPDNPANAARTQRKRGFVYRAVRRFGLGKVFAAFVLILLILGVAAYLLITKL